MGDLVQITVTGTYLDAIGNPLKGKTIRFKPIGVFGDEGIVISRVPVKVVTHATTGAFSVVLLTSDIPGAYVRYQVDFYTGDRKKFDLTDDASPIALEDLINAYDATQAPSGAAMLMDHENRIDAIETDGAPSTPSGAAGGVLGGTYPNPSFAVDMATQAELDVEKARILALEGAPAGASDWGGIGGTLSDQTDLQAALNAKANSLGADDNYVTDAEKVKLSNLSGTNTGDQNLTPYFNKSVDDTDDITEGTNKFATAAEKTKLGHITVTQAVDLDTMESGIASKANDADVVHDTGNETVAGIKTFSSSPIVPTPTTDFQASTKKYVDDSITAGGGYTDEQAQDAVGGMVDTSLVYTDGTPLLSRAALTGDVTASGGSNATTIANDAVTNVKAANMAQATIKGRQSGGGTGDPEDLTAAQARTILNVADGATANDTDANLKNRANHTGTQLASTISDFNSAALVAAPAETGVTLGVLNNAAAAKTTPVNADTFPITDSEASNVIKKISFTNLKAFLKTYFDTLYASVLGSDDNYVTDAEKVKLSNLSGTNTGDQTSIVGITGTVTQFNTAISDGNIIPEGGGTFTGDISVPDEAYGVGWNGSVEVPTKNALYDKIETLGAGGAVDVSGTPTVGQAAQWVDANTLEGVDAVNFSGLSAKSALVNADEILTADSEASGDPKRTTWTSIKAFLKTYLDTLYQPLDSDLTTWAGKTAPSGTAVGTTDAQTLTSKRVTPRVGTTTSSATPTINTDNVDFYHLTAQAADITSFTSNLSGTPTDGQKLWIAITGTASRGLTWGASFESGAATLPTTTVSTTRLDVGFIWNAITSKWRCVAAG